jgi:hypothetical protein
MELIVNFNHRVLHFTHLGSVVHLSVVGHQLCLHQSLHLHQLSAPATPIEHPGEHKPTNKQPNRSVKLWYRGLFQSKNRDLI